MAKNKKARIPHKFLPWIAIRKQYSLTHAEVQMARELGLEPRRFPSYANIKDQPWKKPLKEFIAELYLKQTGKEQPETIYSMEELAAQHVARRLAKKQAKLERLAAEGPKDEASEADRPTAKSNETAAETAEPEVIPAAQPDAELAAEVAPPAVEVEQTERISQPATTETPAIESVSEIPAPAPETQPNAPEIEAPASASEPVAAAPEPKPAPEPEPEPGPKPEEAPPAKPASPWEAARARLIAKSAANPDDPDLTSDPPTT